MRYDRECLYDVLWQKTRISMLGTWDTPSSVNSNISHLRSYASDSTAKDTYERLMRGSNYLAAILLSYGSKEQFCEQRKLVKAGHTNFISNLRLWKPSYPQWDWAQVKHDLEWWTTFTELKALRLDLGKRIQTSIKRTGGTQYRPELMKFVDLLDAEINTREYITCHPNTTSSLHT